MRRCLHQTIDNYTKCDLAMNEISASSVALRKHYVMLTVGYTMIPDLINNIKYLFQHR
jgi:hypothetical protein